MGFHRNEDGDWELTDNKGEFLATWDGKQQLTESLVHHISNEAFKAGMAKGGRVLNKIQRILQDEKI